MALNLAATFFLIYGVIRALPTRPEIQSSRIKACSADGATEPEPDQHGLLWEPYSEARVNELVSGGRIVYIDFTAEWCITCQVNEARVFGSAEVRQMLMAKNVALVKGDWTSSNPVITQALKRYGRNGVRSTLSCRRGGNPRFFRMFSPQASSWRLSGSCRRSEAARTCSNLPECARIRPGVSRPLSSPLPVASPTKFA